MATNSFHSQHQQAAKPTSERRFRYFILEDEWKELRAASIKASARVTPHFSQAHRQYLLCAEESGGAKAKLGYYCGYLPLADDPTFFPRPLSLAKWNTIHADFSASALVAIQIFRYEFTYSLKAVLHYLTKPSSEAEMPTHKKVLLFHGVKGILNSALWERDKSAQIGTDMPVFKTRTGDVIAIPEYLHEAVGAATDGVCCIDCRKSHFVGLSAIELPPALHPSTRRILAAKVSPKLQPKPEPVTSSQEQIVEMKKKKAKKKKKTKSGAQLVPEPALV